MVADPPMGIASGLGCLVRGGVAAASSDSWPEPESGSRSEAVALTADAMKGSSNPPLGMKRAAGVAGVLLVPVGLVA